MKHHMFSIALLSSVIPSLAYGESIKQPHSPGDHVRVAGKHAGQAVSDLGSAAVNLGMGAAEGIGNILDSIWDTLKKPFIDTTDKHKRIEEKQNFLRKAFLQLKLSIFDLLLKAVGESRIYLSPRLMYDELTKIGKELLEEKFKEEYGY